MRPFQEMISALKRPAEYSFSDLFSDDSEALPPSNKKEKIDLKQSSPIAISKYLTKEESLGEEASIYHSFSLSKPKVASPSKPKSPSKSERPCLEDFEEIIAWVEKNKRFLIASFNGELDKWVRNTAKTDPSFTKYKKALVEFIDEFHEEMHADDIVDVRKSHPDKHIESELFPDVYACFIDGVNGLTDLDGRSSEEILPNTANSLLREFLVRNKIIAECLAYGLPTLNEVVEIWTKENPPRSPQKSVLSPYKPPVGKSPSKTVIPKIEKVESNEVSTQATHLLANSMNSFLAHTNTNGELRNPVPLPSTPIKVKRSPVPAPVEPGQQRKERVHLGGQMFPKI